MGTKISRAAVYDALSSYQVPGVDASLVGLKAVRGIDVGEGAVTLQLHLLDAYKDREAAIRAGVAQALGQVAGVERVDVQLEWERTPEPEFKNLLTTVKHCLVVASGKGGVGKSTVAANLAVAMAGLGLKVGLLDADLYGPSMGMMFGIKEAPEGTAEGKIVPIEKFGVKLMSLAFLIDENRPVIWRGPMLNKALTQFLGDVLWGDLDYLFIDLPPGTGDTQISLVQNAKVGRRHHGEHAPGRGLPGRPQGHRPVPDGESAGGGDHREHVQLPLPPLQHGDAHFRARRGKGRRQAHGPAFPGGDSHRLGHPHRRRRRLAPGGEISPEPPVGSLPANGQDLALGTALGACPS